MRVLLFVLLFAVNASAQVAPIKHGHAHNDYMHSRPLFEALENGFTSIEIDVFLHNNELKVAHVGVGLDKKQNIQQLYLDPIKKIIDKNGGNVYKGFNTPVIFMIDFKTGGIETYYKLNEILKSYESIISVYAHDSVIHQRAINILISGNCPIGELLKSDTAFATVDAGINSLDNPGIDKAVTRYSNPWGSYFTWKGKGEMPETQKAKLDSLVAKAHAKHKHIRFYHIPDKPNVWRTLLDAGVDWINTDKLKEYRKFYEQDYRR